MRIIVLMPTESPWSRKFVLELVTLRHTVFVIDIERIKNVGNYVSKKDSFQKEEIKLFSEAVAGIIYIKSRHETLLSRIKCIIRIRRLAQECKTEAIISLYGGMWAMTACLTRLKPLIIYLVGSDILLASRIKKIITSKVLQSAELIFTNGLYLRKKALEIRPKAEIENLYLGIDIKKYSPSWDNSNYDQRNNTKLPNVIYNKFSDTANDEIRIICTRGFEYIYNNKYLIDGLKEISINDIQNLKIIFTSTGSLLAEIKAYADKILTLKQRKNIEFLGGVNEELLIRSLQSSQIYISLSRSDGASISLMEAYSCGLFPILSDIPANQEWINNDNGILVPLDKPVDLAKAIIRAVNDPILRRHAAKINREIVVQNASGIKNVKYFAEKVKIAIAEYNRII